MATPTGAGGQQDSKIWQPLQVGRLQLAHRVIMSPLTRARCPAGIPTDLVAEYYCQRVTKGGLIVSEGIHPSLMVCVDRCFRSPRCQPTN